MAGFQDVVGQEQIIEYLKKSLEQKTISHAYLFCGEKLSGKEYIAKIFARTIQCEKQESEPCESCHSCKQALSENHPDIIYVKHEKPNSIGVEDIRTGINGDIAIKPYNANHKIYIVDEAEKMTVQAQNALLKTLEEPPEYAVIILLVANMELILPTIQSRCVILNMKPVKDEIILAYLMKTLRIPDYKAQICASFARGNVGRAKMLAESEEFDHIRQEAIGLVKNIKKMELHEVMKAIKEIHEYHMDPRDYLDILSVFYRDVLLFKATNDGNQLVFREELQAIKKIADKSAYEGIEEIIRALQNAKSRLQANVNFDLVMELLFITMQEN